MVERTERTGAAGGRSVSPTQAQSGQRNDAQSFERLLRQEQIRRQSQAAQTPKPASQGITFSRHAQQRLDKRQIGLGPEQNRKLADAVQTAAQKGSRTSLVMMDGIAFVVNVKDRMVVTAMDVENGQTPSGTATGNPVFTNIDSAVFA